MFVSIMMSYSGAPHDADGDADSLWLWVESFCHAGIDAEDLYDGGMPVRRRRKWSAASGSGIRAVTRRGSGRLKTPRDLCEEEGFGLVFADGISFGVPVISSDGSEGQREIDCSADVPSQPGDERALAGDLLRIASELELRQSLSSRSEEGAADYSPCVANSNPSVAGRIWLNVFARAGAALDDPEGGRGCRQ